MSKLNKLTRLRFPLLFALLALPAFALAAGTELPPAELVRHWSAWLALAFFGVCYTFVVLEEKTHLRKSIPMIVAAARPVRPPKIGRFTPRQYRGR